MVGWEQLLGGATTEMFKKVASGSRDPLEVVLGTSRRRRRQPLEEVLVDGVTQFNLGKELATSRRHHD